jgi:ribosome-binding ATPase YchF (GTP1/OBG family)
MDKDFMKKALEEKKETKPEPAKDVEVDYKERYGTLRNQINATKEAFRRQISEVKDLIEKRKEEMEILEIKLHKMEGAVEASDLYLKEALPSNVHK